MTNLALTEQELNKKTDIENRYTFYKKHTDPSMGDITLLKDSTTGDTICFKEQIKNSKQQFAQAIMEARERLKLNHSYLIEMKDYSTKQTNDFCSTFYTIRTFYEYQALNLQKEIKNRKDRGIDFTMIELTHLLYNISEACAYLQDRGKPHGDIRPSSIAIMEEGKKFKLIDRADTSIPPFNGQQNYIYTGKDLYVTPQIFSALKGTQQKPNENEYKSDVFSFGLCILEAGLKRGVNNIYSGNSFSAPELGKLLDEFHRKYEDNPLLVTTLRKMLSVDESERPDFKTIINAIPSYTEIIEFFKGDDQYYENDDFTNSQYLDEMGDNAYYNGPNDYQQNPGYGNKHPHQMQQGQGYPNQQQPGYPQGQAYNPYGQQNGNLGAQGGFAAQGGYAPQGNQGQMYQPQPQANPYQQQGYSQAPMAQQNQPVAVNAGMQGQYDQYDQQAGYQDYQQQPPTQPQYQGQYGPQQGWNNPQPAQIPQQGPMLSSQPKAIAQQGQMLPSQPNLAAYPQSAGVSQHQPISTQPSAIKPMASPSSAMLYSQPMQMQINQQPSANISQQSMAGEGDIQVINGRKYREVKEHKTEINEFGQQVKKIIVKLQPLDENVRKVDPSTSMSSQGGVSGTSSSYGTGYTGAYSGGLTGGYNAGTNGYSAQTGYRPQ